LLVASKTAVLHATVSGTVASVSVEEGQAVTPGTPLLQLRNLALESEAAKARQELSTSTSQATLAALRYRDYGAAENERQHRAEDNRLLADKLGQLTVVSPIAGTVTTPRVHDLAGRSLEAGDLLLQVADTSEMKANIYIPEFAMRDVHPGESVRLLIDGQVKPHSGVLLRISAGAAPISNGLLEKDSLQGITLSTYYLGTVILRNDSGLMPGMGGVAKVLTSRRSLAGFTLRFCRDLVRRKVW
jgi:multidrug resistance efflux pump